MGGINFGSDLDKKCGKIDNYDLLMSKKYDFLILFIQKLIIVRKNFEFYFIYGSVYRPGNLIPPSKNFKYDMDQFGPNRSPGPY